MPGEPQPEPEYERGPCERCGARIQAQAEKICQPQRDETGEGTCPADFDAAGYSIRVTPAYLDALGAWILRKVADDAR